MRRDLVLIALAACTRATSDEPAPKPAPSSHSGSADGATNIARADYVGPRVCGDCHASEYARWSQSLHRVMNARSDDDGAVIGDFANATLHYAGGEAKFTHDRDGYAIDVRNGERHTHYRVTRTIGRRGLQEYVGIEDGQGNEVRLPFGWWPRRGGWYPQPYFDPWLGDEASFDAYAPVREPWAERCPWCHSTYPFAERIARASGPRGVGHGMEQLFAAAPGPEVERGGFTPTRGPEVERGGFTPTRGPEVERGGFTPTRGPEVERGGFTPTRGIDRLGLDEQVTTGISCESCHLGGRIHAGGGAIHFVPQGATPRDGVLVPAETFAAERGDAQVVNAVCAQCHSGPSPRLADHTALRNSSEALDLGASPCTGIKCTDCHDPHRADARADDARAIAACTHCHTALADVVAARAHAGAGHATTTCLDCHMPKLVMGIDRFVRTHRIGSPTDRAVLADAGPNACNACHLDRSITWTASELARGWDVHLPIASWERAYRDLDAPLGETWLASTQPALRLIAAHAYARSPLGKAALPKLAMGLGDRLAYVRVWTLFAVEDVLGRTIPSASFDPRADAATRARQLRALQLRAP